MKAGGRSLWRLGSASCIALALLLPSVLWPSQASGTPRLRLTGSTAMVGGRLLVFGHNDTNKPISVTGIVTVVFEGNWGSVPRSSDGVVQPATNPAFETDETGRFMILGNDVEVAPGGVISLIMAVRVPAGARSFEAQGQAGSILRGRVLAGDLVLLPATSSDGRCHNIDDEKLTVLRVKGSTARWAAVHPQRCSALSHGLYKAETTGARRYFER